MLKLRHTLQKLKWKRREKEDKKVRGTKCRSFKCVKVTKLISRTKITQLIIGWKEVHKSRGDVNEKFQIFPNRESVDTVQNE